MSPKKKSLKKLPSKKSQPPKSDSSSSNSKRSKSGLAKALESKGIKKLAQRKPNPLPLRPDILLHPNIPGFERYSITEDGYIWDNKRSRWVPQHVNFEGYWAVNLYSTEGVHRLRRTHTLVLLTFVGYPEKGQKACHKDNDKLNCSRSNLRWGTRVSNLQDRVGHGVKQGNSKLKLPQIKLMRDLHSRGMSYRDLATRFKISENQVSAVVRRICWRFIE